jgi:sodium transport system permease protein
MMAEMSEMRTAAGWWMLIPFIVAAILEELFFRGLLFNALKAHAGPLVTIGASALLFGLTHVMLPGSLGLEKLIPSTLLGLALGSVCWHAGSLWPSMIIHVLHNSIVVGIGLYDPEATNHIHWQWLVGGAAGTLLGVLLLWQRGRKPPVPRPQISEGSRFCERSAW